MRLDIVLPCKGRLEHAKETVPKFLEQRLSIPYRVIVVDYGCPNGAYEWCKEQGHPKLDALKVLNDVDRFNLSRCRNCGTRFSDADFIMAVDADLLVSGCVLEDMLKAVLLRGFLAACLVDIAWQCGSSFMLYRKATWEAVRGYDEAMKGWGAEDSDFYDRVLKMGRICRVTGSTRCSCIQHSEESRTEFYDEKNMKKSWHENNDHALRRAVVNPGGIGLCNWLHWSGLTRTERAGTNGVYGLRELGEDAGNSAKAQDAESNGDSVVQGAEGACGESSADDARTEDATVHDDPGS